jgi:hypothetical protein
MEKKSSRSGDAKLTLAGLDEEAQRKGILLWTYVQADGQLEERIPIGEKIMRRVDLSQEELWARLNYLAARSSLELAPGPSAVVTPEGHDAVEAILGDGALSLPDELGGIFGGALQIYIKREWEQFRLLRCIHQRVMGKYPEWADLEGVMTELAMDDTTLNSTMTRLLAMELLEIPESWSVALTEPGRLVCEAWDRQVNKAGDEEPEDIGDFEALLRMDWSGGPEEASSVFRRDGETWLLVYEGVSKTIKHSRGLEYIAHLLSNPKQEFLAAQLRALVVGSEDLIELGSAGPIMDRQGLSAYRQRIGEIEDELAEAKSNNDLGQAEELAKEQEQVYARVFEAAGLGGRSRKARDAQERARQSISTAIRRAIKTIDKNHGQLGRHLRNSLKIGTFLSYEPDRHILWETSPR